MPTRTILVSDVQKDIPNSLLFYIQVPIEPPQHFFPTRVLQAGVRTNFVREEPLGLRCLTKVLAICVVEDVSINLDILTLEF